MKCFVLDNSITVAFLLGEGSSVADTVFSKKLTVNDMAFVPTLWHLEVRNVLFLKEFSGKLQIGEASQLITSLGKFPITTDLHTTTPSTLMHVERLMLRFGLTSYDAAYLELAYRMGVPIATLDEELKAAAKALKVPVL